MSLKTRVADTRKAVSDRTRARKISNILERSSTPNLTAQEMAGNLIRTKNGRVWAWFRLGPHIWSMRSLEERERAHEEMKTAWAGLVGYHVQLRMTSVPFPRNVWAQRLDANTDGYGASGEGLTPDQWLAAMQERIAYNQLSRPFRALGVQLHGTWSQKQFDQHISGRHDNELTKEVRAVEQKMRVPGFTSQRKNALTPSEMWWLVHRSVGLGMNPPSTGAVGAAYWDSGHMAEFTDPVRAASVPGGNSTQLTIMRDGVEETRHVVVRNLIRLDNGNRWSAEHKEPWLPAIDQFPFHVEVTAHLDIIPGDALTEQMERLQLKAMYQAKHEEETGHIASRRLSDIVNGAGEARDEVENGTPENSTRVYGTIRIAVTGATEQEALERAGVVEEYYARRQSMSLVLRRGQYGLYTEFFPTQTQTLSSLDRENMSNAFWSTAWPGASSSVGDGVGVYVGHTISLAKRAVMVEPHYPIYKYEHSGVTVIQAGLGGGKTTLAGFLAALAAYYRRDDLVAFADPDGRVARLGDVPELKDIVRVIELTGSNVQIGTLNPWSLIPIPRQQDYSSRDAWTAAITHANVERRQLALDIMMRFLPPSVARTPDVRRQMMSALTEAGDVYGTNPWKFVQALERDSDSRGLGKEVRGAAQSPAGLLVFGDEHENDATQVADLMSEASFIILTSPGLPSIDPAKDPIDWTIEEQLSIPIRTTSQVLISRIARHRDRDVRKHLFFDEMGIASQSSAAVAHVQQLARTSRGNTTAMYLISQDAADLERLQVSNWVTRSWIGRSNSEQDARIALRLAGLSETSGYESSILSKLSKDQPGQFIYTDEVKQSEPVQVDMDWWPNVKHALERKRPKVEDQEWVAGAAY